ncbi:MAG: hypothetical protein KDA27_08940 [Candidatus Eisenbacteria bacterium]|uniref:Uncharacterized protein n=1 Tax=Eiseniibacteriota bacterium TaxID=2212470 RepID=A0A956NDH0_UNCEI|nr:hypothetical protein [Candidatus Eisenbacteria bacterium]MCB9464473.1 hypothetical protein [Candidatus Eisenbacteria bacterium]
MIEVKLTHPIDQVSFERKARDYGFGPKSRDDFSGRAYYSYLSTSVSNELGNASNRLSFRKSGSEVLINCYSYPGTWDWGWTHLHRSYEISRYFDRWLEEELKALDRFRAFLQEEGIGVAGIRRSSAGSPSFMWAMLILMFSLALLLGHLQLSLGPMIAVILLAIVAICCVGLYRGGWQTEEEFRHSNRT